jgi:hypothetical protein
LVDPTFDRKAINLQKYEVNKLTKEYNRLKKKIISNKELGSRLEKRVGHYSVRNVNKRDLKAKENLYSLRDLQRTVRKQEKLIKAADEIKQHFKLTIELSSTEKE